MLRRVKPKEDGPEKFHNGDDQPMIFSSLGVFKLPNELINPKKAYTFWLGFTNFRITEGVAKTIEDTDGVEVFDILSPYRFRLAVAKLFKSADVKHDIVKRLRAEEVNLPINVLTEYKDAKKDNKPTEPDTK